MRYTRGVHRRLPIRQAGFLATLALVACSGVLSDAPPLTVPLAASMPGEPPEPVPLWRFFANRESTWGYKVSPDGQRLGWIASHARRATVFSRPVGDGQVSIIDTHSPRSVFDFEWAADSRRIFYLQDSDGDERYHVIAEVGTRWDYVITVYDPAFERCPEFPDKTSRLHWSVEDPSQATGTGSQQLEVFRRVRDDLTERITRWVADRAERP